MRRINQVRRTQDETQSKCQSCCFRPTSFHILPSELRVSYEGAVCLIRKIEREISCLRRLNLLNYQRAILRSKTNAVAERSAHVSFARLKGNVIEVAIRIGIVEVNCRRNDASFDRTKRCA